MFTKRNQLLYLAILVTVLFSGCHKTTTTTTYYGDYVMMSLSDAYARSNATAFTIGDLAYITCGVGNVKYNDLWSFDPNLNAWTQKVDFPGTARYDAAGFAINGKGYVGLGYDLTTFFQDFYRYDPKANKWDTVATFPGNGRQSSVSFSYDIANQNAAGFVGTGNNGSDLKDFWKYSPATDQWTQIISIPGYKRTDAIAFTIDSLAYVGMGITSGSYVNDFYSLDMTTGEWKARANPAQDNDKNGSYEIDMRRSGATAFTVKRKGYITTGNYNGFVYSTWEYDPATNQWTQKNNWEAAGRIDAVGFTVNQRGFVYSGRNGITRYYDCYEFLPDNTQVAGN